MNTKAVIYEQNGSPAEVLKIAEISLPNMGDNQVLIEFIKASINPSDLGMIAGSYGRLKTLPAVAGREGIGRILEIGKNVKNVKIGDIVRLPEDYVLQQKIVCDSENLMVLPKGLDENMLTMAFVNPPTAYLILKEFVNLKQGDYVIQNAANSALGFFTIQLCKHFGYKTINVVRDTKKWEYILKENGADIVISDKQYDLVKEYKPMLGLNSVGGENVANMSKLMGYGGKIVTFGGMTGEKVRFPTRFLIFNDLTLCGFWWDKWQKNHTQEEIDQVFKEIFALIEKGVLKAPIDEIFDFENSVEAFKKASNSDGVRKGKILIKG